MKDLAHADFLAAHLSTLYSGTAVNVPGIGYVALHEVAARFILEQQQKIQQLTEIIDSMEAEEDEFLLFLPFEGPLH